MKYCLTCNEKFDDSLSFCPTDGDVLEEDPTSLLGNVLDGQYQMETILGKGGMGAVYRARHILLGDRVAIKLLPPEMRSNTEWLRRFQREGQAARRFRHPNAVTVYDLRTSSDGTIYLVMEYVEGKTLDAELKSRGRFSPAEALAVLDPIMSVLNAAHAMGVVHRDLKPENIMIGRPSTGGAPVVKLLDLGIAKLREVAGAEKTGTTALTIAGQMLGTPYYMSPEQWGELPDDGNSEIDGRADIYSLGVVFYELVAGRRPFSGMTLPELRRQHISVVPALLHEVDPGVPEGFSRAIARAMSKDRSQRQATAEELETELRTALTAEGIAPASITSTPTADRDTAGPRSSITAAERTAPTIVSEPVNTAAEGDAQVSASDYQSRAGTMPTMVAAEPELAATHLPESKAAAARDTKRRGSPNLIVAGVIGVLLVLGIAGYAVINLLNRSKSNPVATNSSNSNNAPDSRVGGHEVGRYWLEVSTPKKDEAIRAGDSVTMNSGQDFKFHFSPSKSGYLYIIGPGEKNAPTTFLTNKPVPQSGLKTNEVKSGVDFSFPADAGAKANWITLDVTPGTDEFIVIFSPVALTQPAFLDGPSGRPLTADEQAQLTRFRDQWPGISNQTWTDVITTGASPFVSVKVPQNADEDASVIFRVRIEHK